MYNTGRLVVFVRVLGEGVEGAFLKECEAAFLRLPINVVNRIWQGGCFGSKGWCCKKILTQLIIKGAPGCSTLAEWWYLFVSWAKAWRGRP